MKDLLVGLIHNMPAGGEYEYAESSRDVLVQVEAIEEALCEIGYPSRRIPFTRNLGEFVRTFQEEGIDVAFNLCETVDEVPCFAGHPAAVLELMGIPFSGSPSVALMSTTDKVMTKHLLKAWGIRTPDYLIYEGSAHFNTGYLRFPLIVKPRYEDASIGIDQESIFGSEKHLRQNIKRLYDRFGPLMVEEYIEGREFNLSLFGYPEPAIMPIAEIDFSAFPADMYSIVGYRAKWDASSFEYTHTPRIFPDELPGTLRKELNALARQCFRLFQLRDYARVDVRVDSRQKPSVLEVNANPCLSPDAGFVASMETDGIGYTEMVSRLLDFMIQRSH